MSYGRRSRPSGSGRRWWGGRHAYVHLLGVDDPQRPAGVGAVVVDDHALAVLPAEEVGPAGVEPEGLVRGEADRREDGDLRGQQDHDPAADRPPAATCQPRPQPHRADEQQHGGQHHQRQHLVTRKTHRVVPRRPFFPCLSLSFGSAFRWRVNLRPQVTVLEGAMSPDAGKGTGSKLSRRTTGCDVCQDRWGNVGWGSGPVGPTPLERRSARIRRRARRAARAAPRGGTRPGRQGLHARRARGHRRGRVPRFRNSRMHALAEVLPGALGPFAAALSLSSRRPAAPPRPRPAPHENGGPGARP